jgi:DNA adenine methylase
MHEVLGRRMTVQRFSLQLFKWIGNKQRFAHEIIAYFPAQFETYIEPFLGSGAILGTLAPAKAVAGDVLVPLMDIWTMLAEDPQGLVRSYSRRWRDFQENRESVYVRIRDRYNAKPNPKDLFFLSRSCYGGVVRFRKEDGYMSTPIGVHRPVSPESLSHRVEVWHFRTRNTKFVCADFEETMSLAKSGDMIYCDPPYFHTQAILYGAQDFDLNRLFRAIEKAKHKGVFVALSLDGKKKSGNHHCKIAIPSKLFERIAYVNCGRSMLRRFQMAGRTLESEVVADRLLLTY